MNSKKFNIYYFGDIGAYDEYNPDAILSKDYAHEILYLIAKNNPYEITSFDIATLLNLDNVLVNNLLSELKRINAITERNHTYKINFPVFLENDLYHIKDYLQNVAPIIGKKIISIKDLLEKEIRKFSCFKNFPNERIMYHIVGDSIFDGYAFSYFSERNLLTQSKKQPGNKDYIIIGYENKPSLSLHSRKLLCSSNNYYHHNITFNSFGDGDGNRKDMFRFLRMFQKCISHFSPYNELNTLYNDIITEYNDNFFDICYNIFMKAQKDIIVVDSLNKMEKKVLALLCEMRYLEVENKMINIVVPIFYTSEAKLIRTIGENVLSTIFEDVKRAFLELERINLTSNKHHVERRDIANEMWHQIFGFTNDYLISGGFIQAPDSYEGEGKYLKSITIKDI